MNCDKIPCPACGETAGYADVFCGNGAALKCNGCGEVSDANDLITLAKEFADAERCR
jgi:hypothetical protein